MERLATTILGPFPLTPRGNKFVLVVTDYFTKWRESYPIPNQDASTVAEKSVGEFIIVCRFGVPREIHSEQGTNSNENDSSTSTVGIFDCTVLPSRDRNASRRVERESRRLGLATSRVHDGLPKFRP